MTNKEIASSFNLFAKLLELHGENPFKTRSYSNAYLTIRRLDKSVLDMSIEELSELRGVGKAIVDKLQAIKEHGYLPQLEELKKNTPEGVLELLQIKGLGAKKVRQLQNELQINTPGELLYACEENRLVALSGFGQKTQVKIRDAVNYHLESKGSYLFGHIEKQVHELLEILREALPEYEFEVIGDFARKNPVVTQLEFLSTCDNIEDILEASDFDQAGDMWKFQNLKFDVQYCDEESFVEEVFISTVSEEFIDQLGGPTHGESEESIFENLNLPYIPAECREFGDVLRWSEDQVMDILEETDIKGVVHNHSTYSDGLHTVQQMADATKAYGFQYLVMTDHSKSAFYANGLSEERLYSQIEEIAALNQREGSVKIFTGIESDILSDGSLDYADDVLADLDVIIASVHSNLNMDVDKATTRLIKAIEHPMTRMLGHPTGRLLLSRKGYPLHFEKVIDACAANNVVIEVNANPYRLDMDWTWIPLALSRGVKFSINPDAHAMEGIHDIRYGVAAARKGLLTKDMTVNALDTAGFEEWVKNGK